MRPRKKVLLYCPDEKTASEMRFKIELWGYSVECRDRSGLKGLRKDGFDLALVISGISGSEAVGKIKSSHSRLPVLEMLSRHSLAESTATHVVYGDVEELRWKLKMAAARKRGPRKAEA